MKVFTLLFLIFALIVTMVACKDIDTDPTPTTAAATTQAPTTVGVVTTTDVVTTETPTTVATTTEATTTAVTTAVTTSWLEEWQDSWQDKFVMPTLEPDKQNLPTYAELCELQVGMAYMETIEKVGNPQRSIEKTVSDFGSNASDVLCYVFDSCDGGSIVIHFRGYFLSGGEEFFYGIANIWEIAE